MDIKSICQKSMQTRGLYNLVHVSIDTDKCTSNPVIVAKVDMLWFCQINFIAYCLNRSWQLTDEMAMTKPLVIRSCLMCLTISNCKQSKPNSKSLKVLKTNLIIINNENRQKVKLGGKNFSQTKSNMQVL